MLQRLTTALFVLVAAWAGLPAPAYAATAGAAPFIVTYGSGLGTTMAAPARRALIGVKAWGSTPITNAVVTLDATAVSARVKVVGASGPCTHTTTRITCSFGTVSRTKKTAYAVFQAVDVAQRAGREPRRA